MNGTNNANGPPPGSLDVEGALRTALAHHRAGRLGEAKELYRRVLRSDPEQADALNLLGVAVLDGGDAAEAVRLIRRAIAVDGGEAHYYTNLGNALQAAGDVDEAVAVYRRGLALDPGAAKAHNNLGNALRAQNRLTEAVACYRRALEIDAEYPSAWSNLGAALVAVDRMDEASSALRQALMIMPDSADALVNLGNVLHIQGKLAEAEEAMRRALEIDPGYAMAYSNLGILLKDLGRFEEAEESLTRALEIDPGYALAKNNFAFTLLVQGDFARAWGFYAARASVREVPQELWQEPLPDGLGGKRIFLRTDQGLGDDIFFLRFAPALKERGAWICHDPGPKIASIAARLPFIDEIIGEGEEPQGVDFTLSVADLPLALGMISAADIPPPLTLAPEPGHTDAMRGKLASLGPAPTIGVTWRAGIPNKADAVFKLAPLGDIAEALRPANATVLVLQRHPGPGEIDALSRGLGRKAHDLTALNDDLEDMLALLALLDEYVTVSNTNVHLRAGAGRASRVLVPDPPEWRWMAMGDESPWFPGSAVYRQGRDGDWGAAFGALAKDLHRALDGGG
ncbi:MAG: tetratricopeptide repeat protein [Proteobacteria bacterium]|nr:tetratricopeptide repeat protein [Pseudomonadota bacterium]